MNIGEALNAVINGEVVTRDSWKSQVLFQAGGYSVPAENLKPNGPITIDLLYACDEPNLNIAPHIDLFDGYEYHTGYTLTQEDIFADDWRIVEDAVNYFMEANDE